MKALKFNTTRGRTNRFQLNFRNHRKIVVVDGQEAWVGGHNVAEGEHSVAALALPSGPDDPFETCTLFYIKAIHSAKKRLWIAR